MDIDRHRMLVASLLDAPRLTFQRGIMDVFNEVGGVFAIWRNETLLHVEATADLGFELHLVRHGMQQRSPFIAQLFEAVVRPAVNEHVGLVSLQDSEGATQLLVRDQLTYGVQVAPVAGDDLDELSAELRRRLALIAPSNVSWGDGWSLPVDDGR